MQQMHGIIPSMFDYWANPVAHLLQLKNYMVANISLGQATKV